MQLGGGGGGAAFVVIARGSVRLAVTVREGELQLVGENLHGGGHVEGTEIRIRGDRGGALTQIQLLVGNPGLLATKHQCYLTVVSLLDGPRGKAARRPLREFEAPVAHRRAHHPHTVRQRLLQ